MTEMIPTIEPLDVALVPGTVQISGRILARDVPYEAFLEADYGEAHVEWVNGVVIQMASIDRKHNFLTQFLLLLLRAFLERHGGGLILQDLMLMKLPTVPSSRAPDIQVLLPDPEHQLKQNQVIGPASLVIEVVSQGSIRADYIEKRREYQLGGVPEYWLFDPIKQATLFLRLNESGVYDEVDLDAEGVYTSAVLAGFKLPVHILWQEPLPSLSETLAIVAAMK